MQNTCQHMLAIHAIKLLMTLGTSGQADQMACSCSLVQLSHLVHLLAQGTHLKPENTIFKKETQLVIKNLSVSCLFFTYIMCMLICLAALPLSMQSPPQLYQSLLSAQQLLSCPPEEPESMKIKLIWGKHDNKTFQSNAINHIISKLKILQIGEKEVNYSYHSR